MQVGYGVGLVLSTGLVALISRSMDNAAFLSWAGVCRSCSASCWC
ncbi:hypothetical protein QFZ91_007008 [Paraburkholderia sp. JPY419]